MIYERVEQVTLRPDGAPTDEFVGYRPAAKHLGLSPNTLSSYMSKGIGPFSHTRRPGKGNKSQYLLYVFTRAALDEWKRERIGQGARTDLPLRAVKIGRPVQTEVSA